MLKLANRLYNKYCLAEKEINLEHGDHGLQQVHIDFLKEKLKDENGFFIKIFKMPEELPSLPCMLHGPSEGDDAIGDNDAIYESRNGRPNKSRLVNRDTRPARYIVAIGSGSPEKITVYTAYGSLKGIAPPQEPEDPDLEESDKPASQEFWSQHALSSGKKEARRKLNLRKY
jgi:hypothetical protein